eukprot:CAMPEP_0170146870 /NCGR_PEP_ID=MMETSP0033_2-20121228/32233_1 /TAXON_ID=195969 /ORGANISM="Dolichomastix tenuilepis, Strain CCMP3274" /LENGTH=284 /DNA_ID=CAMNT_0010383635 /DNA_START=84 /DNA_END=934 /DNA_ORIENTATION=-
MALSSARTVRGVVTRQPQRAVSRRSAGAAQASAAVMERVKVSVMDTKDDVQAELCKLVVAAAEEAIAGKGAFSLAVPGGSIPKMLSALPSTEGASDVDWSKAHIYFVNERQNEGKCCNLNREQFADALGIPIENINAPATGESGPSAAAYSATMRAADASVLTPSASGGAPSLDLALIGLGNDGHIGSVYPGSEAAGTWDVSTLVLPVDMPGKQSISMSLAMMAAAKQTVVASCGAAKVESVQLALSLTAEAGAWQGPPAEGDAVPWLNAPSARLASGPEGTEL